MIARTGFFVLYSVFKEHRADVGKTSFEEGLVSAGSARPKALAPFDRFWTVPAGRLTNLLRPCVRRQLVELRRAGRRLGGVQM